MGDVRGVDSVEAEASPDTGDAATRKAEAERGRRSDRRRSSRRHRRKRERAEAKEAARRRREGRRAQGKRGKATPGPVGGDLEIDLDAEPSPMLASADDSPDLIARRSGPLARVGRVAMVLAIVAVGAGIGVGARLLTRDADPTAAEDDTGVSLPPGVDRQPALLLATAEDSLGPAPAESLIVLAYDRVEQSGTILLVPTSTVTDIPGHGVLPISRSFEFGGPALTSATMDNLLGVSLDGVAGMSYQSWATLLGRAGELTVEVPERLVVQADDGGTEVQFLAGVQTLDGPRAAEYLGARVIGQPELSGLPRVQGLLVAWLEALAGDVNLLDEVVADGLPMIDTGMARDELVALLRLLVQAHADDRLDFRVLPVRPIGSGAQEGYRPDDVRLAELVEDRFAGSVPVTDRQGRSLQVLNGNGLPGIGQDVAARLLPAGFRVVLTGNADDFDHEVTKIIVFDDTPEQLAIANEIRDLLGVGEVEISLTPQSVVDITIVVGRDFAAS